MIFGNSNTFSADEALEASEAGDPIMLTRKAVTSMLTEHGALLVDFVEEVADAQEYDAWVVLEWLGY